MTRVLALALTAAWLAGGCASLRLDAEPGAAPPPPGGPRVSVVTSFYPLYEFAKRIGGDAVEVRNLVPAGAAPHDFEPSPQDVAALHTARVLIYNGAGFEPWIEKLLPTLPAAVERVETTGACRSCGELRTAMRPTRTCGSIRSWRKAKPTASWPPLWA